MNRSGAKAGSIGRFVGRYIGMFTIKTLKNSRYRYAGT